MKQQQREAVVSAAFHTPLTLTIIIEDGLYDEWRVMQSLRFGVFEPRGREIWQPTLTSLRRHVERCVRGHRPLIERAVAGGNGARVRVCGTPSSALALSGLGAVIATILSPLRTQSALAPDGLGLEVSAGNLISERPVQRAFDFGAPGDGNIVRFPSRGERLVQSTSLAAAFASDPRLFRLTGDLYSRGIRTIGDLSALPKGMLRTLIANDMDFLRLELRLYELGLS